MGIRTGGSSHGSIGSWYILLCSFLLTVQAFHHPRLVVVQPPSFGVSRGGGDNGNSVLTTPTPLFSVGLLGLSSSPTTNHTSESTNPDDSLPIWLSQYVDSKDASNNVLLFGPTSSTLPLATLNSKPSLDHGAMQKTMGNLCDVLLLSLPQQDGDIDMASCLEQVRSITQERKARGLTKPHVILLTQSEKDPILLEPSGDDCWESVSVWTCGSFTERWKTFWNRAAVSATLMSPKTWVDQWSEEYDQHATMSVPFQPSLWEEPVPQSISTIPLNDDNQSSLLLEEVLNRAMADMMDLETQGQQRSLDDAQTMPMLDFGKQANSILSTAYKELRLLPEDERCTALSPLVQEIQRLYEDHLQALRDYYGRRYETFLTKSSGGNDSKHQADRCIQGFQAAARHAIPKLCQEGGPLEALASFQSVSTLQGLVQDMMDTTEWQETDELLMQVETEQHGDETFQPDTWLRRTVRRVKPWAKKIASRLLVLSVNYVQGWLAWQALRHAAMERDREMPKFPLF